MTIMRFNEIKHEIRDLKQKNTSENCNLNTKNEEGTCEKIDSGFNVHAILK